MKVLLFYFLFLLLAHGQTSEEFSSRGFNKELKKDYLGAISDYSKAIEISPNNPQYYLRRANLKNKLQDYRGSISDCNKIITIDPKFFGVYDQRGLNKFKLKDFIGAREDFDKAIELYSDDISAYYIMAQLNFDLKNYTSAIEDFNEVIEIIQDYNKANNLDINNKKDMPLAFYYRGLSFIFSGKIETGCLDLSKAGELEYEDAYEAIKKYCN